MALRKLLLILLLPAFAQAQTPMSKMIRKQASSCSLLLDSYTSAAFAYSVRKIKCGYSGNCLKVRRSSDDTETDIGFTVDGNLDTATMKTFVGVYNGFISIWYDQSGNGNNAIQSTTGTQPQIINSGVIYRQNGIPSIFMESRYFGLTTSVTATYPWSSFIVQKKFDAGSAGLFVGQDAHSVPLTPMIYADGNTYIGDASGTFNYGSFNTTDFGIIEGFTTASATYSCYYTGSSVSIPSSSTLDVNPTFNLLGARYGGIISHGYCSEVIFYSNDKTASRTGIETNIITYYGL